MQHRTTTVGMIGVGMLALALCSSASANTFYTAGTAQQIQGADDFGTTIVNYLVTLGLPVISVTLMGGGLLAVKRNPGAGGAGIGAGIAAGYLAQITGNLHQNASAVAALADLPAVAPDWSSGVAVLLQATILATVMCYQRWRRPCGKPVAASLMNP